jgi:predicted RNA-binding Zn-ribbon protein involved in translation (DUF1610 family)
VSVYYRCKACGGEHPPPVSYAEKLYFDAAATLELQFECPETGREGLYNRTDMVWREDTEPEEAQPSMSG